MTEYRILKYIIDEDDGTLSIQDIMILCKIPEKEARKHLQNLQKKQCIYEEDGFYFLTVQGRLDFAKTFSRQMMLILISISIVMACLFYLISKLK